MVYVPSVINTKSHRASGKEDVLADEHGRCLHEMDVGVRLRNPLQEQVSHAEAERILCGRSSGIFAVTGHDEDFLMISSSASDDLLICRCEGDAHVTEEAQIRRPRSPYPPLVVRV